MLENPIKPQHELLPFLISLIITSKLGRYYPTYFTRAMYELGVGWVHEPVCEGMFMHALTEVNCRNGNPSMYQKCIKVVICLRNCMKILHKAPSFSLTMTLISGSKSTQCCCLVLFFLPVSFALVIYLFRNDFPILPKVVSVFNLIFKFNLIHVYFLCFHCFLMNELSLVHCRHYINI